MSKYMQIDIRIIPFYEKRFEKRFPNIADLLRRMSHKDLVEREVSFYEMACKHLMLSYTSRDNISRFQDLIHKNHSCMDANLRAIFFNS